MLKRFYFRLLPVYWIIRWKIMRIVCYVIGCEIFKDWRDTYTYCNRCGAMKPKIKFNFYLPFDTYIEKEKSILYKIKKILKVKAIKQRRLNDK